jgi:hypothetical protein
MPVNPNSKKGTGNTAKVILRSEIEEAQKHTESNAAAAKWLGVPYPRYKKYAELYGIFERHLNPDGVGISKGFAKNPTTVPLRDIFQNKHPDYSVARLKNRLIARKKLPEECALCGFHEQRVTDRRIPLILNFKDGNRKNMALDNLYILCYNCTFLTTGAPQVSGKAYLKTLEGKGLDSREGWDHGPRETDQYDPEEDELLGDVEVDEDERQAWLDELNQS